MEELTHRTEAITTYDVKWDELPRAWLLRGHIKVMESTERRFVHFLTSHAGAIEMSIIRHQVFTGMPSWEARVGWDRGKRTHNLKP